MDFGSARRQCGFSIVAAIFLIVVLALLGVFIVTIGAVQRSTTVFAGQGARAYHAARSGSQWGVRQALNTPLGTICGLSTVTTGPFTLTGAGLDTFQVTVACTYTEHTESGSAFEVFQINSTAESGTFGTLDYYSRRIQTTVTNAPAP